VPEPQAAAAVPAAGKCLAHRLVCSNFIYRAFSSGVVKISRCARARLPSVTDTRFVLVRGCLIHRWKHSSIAPDDSVLPHLLKSDLSICGFGDLYALLVRGTAQTAYVRSTYGLRTLRWQDGDVDLQWTEGLRAKTNTQLLSPFLSCRGPGKRRPRSCPLCSN
jgi:hypothetical protein